MMSKATRALSVLLLFAIICFAKRMASVIASLLLSNTFTCANPKRTASSPLIASPKTLANFALETPTALGSFVDNPQDGSKPISTCVSIKTAFLVTNTISAANAISNPAFIAIPFTTQTIGISHFSIACTTSASKSNSDIWNTSFAASKFIPDENASSPSPVNIMHLVLFFFLLFSSS